MELPVAPFVRSCYIRCTMTDKKKIYIVFFKPYDVVSQFSFHDSRRTLRDFGPFPPDVYPVGRLDADSEGLVLLTNDNSVKHRLSDPLFGHPRTYLVQIEGNPSPEALRLLESGVVIEGKITRPVRIRLLNHEPGFPPRPVPIRYRVSVPTSWIEMTLHEGRNRQVRKMTASVGYPTLRLVRTAIDFLTLEGLTPGKWRYLGPGEIAELLRRTVKPDCEGKHVRTNLSDTPP
jgi:23S rRNA pseudouridine2457 synthase